MLSLFFAFLLFFHKAAAECELVLHIDGSRSIFNVSGVGDSALISDIALNPLYPNQRVGFTGALLWTSPGGCPSNQQQLRRILSDGNFSLVSDEGIKLYPNNATLDASGLASLNFVDFQFDASWKDFQYKNGTKVDAKATLDVSEGAVDYVVNPSLGFDVDPGNVSLVDLSSVQRQDLLFALNGSKFELEITKAQFRYKTAFETGVALLPEINITLELKGSLFAEAFVECSEIECGENGRCVALDSGENACTCGCGWTGKNCDIPSGFCDPFGASVITETVSIKEEPKKENMKSFTKRCEEYFSTLECPDSRSTYSIEKKGCVCTEGWYGKECDLCTEGNACSEFFEEGSYCYTDVAYDPRSGNKIYECDLRSTGLDVFVGDTIKFSCNTTGPRFYDEKFQEMLKNNDSISVVGNTPFCDVNFVYDETKPVQCKTWGCEFEAGSTRVECSDLICECNDCDAVLNLVNGVTGVVLDCENNGNCEVGFEGLALSVEAPCEVRECIQPNNPEFTSTVRGDGGFKINKNVLVISLPLAFLLLLLIVFGFPTVLLSKQISRRTSRKKAENIPMKPLVNEGAEICFENVRCAVSMPSERSFLPWKWLSMQKKRKHLENESFKASLYPSRQLYGLSAQLKDHMTAPSGFKSVLHGISGVVQKGQFLGVMGPSGGGKTTFLSIICSVSAEQATQRQIDGQILINGRRTGRWTQRIVAFVPQDDKLIGTLTVRECLLYSAILRRPGNSMAEIRTRVQQTLHELNLYSIRYSQVGGIRNRRGISGGERRRVTIGMELVTDPNLIILDEPTSGLDSYTALNLMTNLKDISQRGRTVIMSLHQPSPAMLDMLDQVLLLAKGFQVYLGPPGEAAEFFARHQHPRKDESVPIGEHMLQMVSSAETLVPLLNSITQQPRTEANASESPSASSQTEAAPIKRQSVFTMIRILLWRGFVDIFRNPALLTAHVTVAVLIGLFCGSIFYHADLTVDGAQNRLGAAFFILAFLGFWSLTTIDLLHEERSTIARETSGGYYNAYVYLFSKILLDAILLRAIPAILMSLPIYFLMQLQQVTEKFFIFLFTVSTFNITVGLLSMAVTLLSPSAGTASLLINTLLLVGLLFAGHLVNIPSMPSAVRWLHYISPFHYGFQILSVNELLGLRLTFVVPGYASVSGIGGEVFLDTIGITDHDITYDLIIFVIFYAISFILAFICMWISRHLHKISSIFKALW